MSVWTSTAKLFSDAVTSILDGTIAGAVFPPKDPPPIPGEDGRTHALRALRTYIIETPFQIPNPPNPPKPFKLTARRFQLEMPETPKNLLFPSVVIVEGPSKLIPIGLTPSIDEDSIDVFGKGTALLRSWEYSEEIKFEVWADTRAMRRALAAGIEAALSPVEDIGAIRLRMPDYFGETVRFTPTAVDRVDGELAGDRRRRLDLGLTMELEIVRLVNVVTKKPVAIVNPTDPTAPST